MQEKSSDICAEKKVQDAVDAVMYVRGIVRVCVGVHIGNNENEGIVVQYAHKHKVVMKRR